MDLVRVGVRAEPDSVSLVQGIISYYAKRYGIPSDETERFLITVEEAMAQVIEYGFPGKPDSMFDVNVGIEGLDLVVTIIDKGIPYDYEMLAKDPGAMVSLTLLKGFADKVSLSSMGPAGRKQVLMKHLSSLPEYTRREETPVPESCGFGPEDIDYHFLRREEAIEVAQCMYDEFGYTYPHEIVYHPDEFYESTQRGECISVVATVPGGEVAGHAALVSSPRMRGTMELCMGVVRKKYRKCSIMSRITEMAIARGKEMGLTSVNAMPVIYHIFTQKVCNKQGMYPNGFVFNLINEDLSTSFEQGFRASLGLATLMLEDRERNVYVRDTVLPIAEYIISVSKIKRKAVPVKGDISAEGDSDVAVDVDTRVESGRINVDYTGSDIDSRIKAADRYIRSQKCKISNVYLSVSSPQSVLAYDSLVSLGYYCTGLFTGCNDNDYLMMENVMLSNVDYGKIQTIEPFTGLLDLVKEGDPHA